MLLNAGYYIILFQVRSSSEAICETVGSIMNNHCGKGRHLRPVNFNKEIFLEFNLGPTYLTENLVRSVYKLRKKEYLYKETSVGGMTHWAHKRVDMFGSALKTFRKEQLEKSRFPAEFWECE